MYVCMYTNAHAQDWHQNSTLPGHSGASKPSTEYDSSLTHAAHASVSVAETLLAQSSASRMQVRFQAIRFVHVDVSCVGERVLRICVYMYVPYKHVALFDILVCEYCVYMYACMHV